MTMKSAYIHTSFIVFCFAGNVDVNDIYKALSDKWAAHDSSMTDDTLN